MQNTEHNNTATWQANMAGKHGRQRVYQEQSREVQRSTTVRRSGGEEDRWRGDGR